MKLIVVDTETTGLNPSEDELLQVSIIDDSNNVLLDTYCKPQKTSTWPGAESVNHISPEMVSDAPAITDLIGEINQIVKNADVICGYNTSFDLGFLKSAGLTLDRDPDIIDVMKLFAPIYGEWNDYYEDYKWQKLTTCALYYGYDWNARGIDAHNSLADCYATLYCYNKIMEERQCTNAD